MENIDDELLRSNVIYNLSGIEDFNSFHETDSDESSDDERDVDDTDGSDSTSTDNNERDDISDEANIEGHIPTAQWFTTEEITSNTITDNPGDYSNFNMLGDDLFKGQCFADKQTAVNAIKTSHIKQARNYRVMRSDTTLYEAKCVIAECPWRIRVMKKKRHGYFEISKLPFEHNCMLRTLERDHKKLSSRLIANVIKQQVIYTYLSCYIYN